MASHFKLLLFMVLIMMVAFAVASATPAPITPAPTTCFVLVNNSTFTSDPPLPGVAQEANHLHQLAAGARDLLFRSIAEPESAPDLCVRFEAMLTQLPPRQLSLVLPLLSHGWQVNGGLFYQPTTGASCPVEDLLKLIRCHRPHDHVVLAWDCCRVGTRVLSTRARANNIAHRQLGRLLATYRVDAVFSVGFNLPAADRNIDGLATTRLGSALGDLIRNPAAPDGRELAVRLSRRLRELEDEAGVAPARRSDRLFYESFL